MDDIDECKQGGEQNKTIKPGGLGQQTDLLGDSWTQRKQHQRAANINVVITYPTLCIYHSLLKKILEFFASYITWDDRSHPLPSCDSC